MTDAHANHAGVGREGNAMNRSFMAAVSRVPVGLVGAVDAPVERRGIVDVRVTESGIRLGRDAIPCAAIVAAEIQTTRAWPSASHVLHLATPDFVYSVRLPAEEVAGEYPFETDRTVLPLTDRTTRRAELLLLVLLVALFAAMELRR